MRQCQSKLPAIHSRERTGWPDDSPSPLWGEGRGEVLPIIISGLRFHFSGGEPAFAIFHPQSSILVSFVPFAPFAAQFPAPV